MIRVSKDLYNVYGGIEFYEQKTEQNNCFSHGGFDFVSNFSYWRVFYGT